MRSQVSMIIDNGYAITPPYYHYLPCSLSKNGGLLKVLILTSTFIRMAGTNSILRSILVVDIGHGFIGSIYGRVVIRCRDDA